jgi:hypothetical protein
MDVNLELLRNKTNQGREKVRRIKVEGMGERGRSRAHGRRRIRADALADMADSGERFLPPGGVSGEREKGARGRRWRGFYRPGLDGHLVREITVGSKRRRLFPERKGEKIAGKTNPIGGTGMSAGERREGHTPSGFAGMGRGSNLARAGLVSPRPFLPFFISFSFFFLISISFI